jgi:hypothetical protein
MGMENHGGVMAARGKQLIRPPELCGSLNKLSSSIAGEYEKEIMNLAVRSTFVRTKKGFLHAVKSYNMRPTALLPLRRNACCGFLSTLKVHRPRPGLNPQTVDLMASTLTIT